LPDHLLADTRTSVVVFLPNLPTAQRLRAAQIRIDTRQAGSTQAFDILGGIERLEG